MINLNGQAHSRVAATVASDNLRKSSCCLGADSLLTLLGNYCHNHSIKTSITIGIVGEFVMLGLLLYLNNDHCVEYTSSAATFQLLLFSVK